MAKKKAVKVQKEFDQIRNPAKFLFDFSNWKNMTGQEFHKLRWTAHRFYSDETKVADLQTEVITWMKNNKYSKKDIEKAKAFSFHPTTGILCKLIRSGCPDYNPKENEYWTSLRGTNNGLVPITNYIKNEVELSLTAYIKSDIKTEEATPAKVISIQDRIKQQVTDLSGELEGCIDDIMAGTLDIKDFNPYRMIQSNSVAIKPAHARIIKDSFEAGYNEIQEALESSDDYVKESYSHLSTKRKKLLASAYEAIISACQLIIGAGKAVRKSRKPKVVSKEKLISRLKFKIQDTEFNVSSVNPIDIVGAKEVWVFNTKYRDIGHYVADEMIQTLSVKGSTIVGFDETKSIKKKLRKPKEQLKEFISSGKVGLRKFMDNIKTRDSNLNGRINKDTIILKVIH